LRETLSGEIEF
jgi:hypothetical protein